MEAIDLNPEVHEPPAESGLGERLVAVREARGLSRGDVLRVLRLPEATLQALESGCYEKLPAPVFVRGYLRAYALLLGMDAEVFVAEYNRLVETPEPVLTPVTSGHRQSTARDLYIRGAAALIVLTMVVLLGSWWYGRLNQDVHTQSRTATSEDEQPASPVSVLTPSRTDATTPGSGPVVAIAPDYTLQHPASEVAEEILAAIDSETPLDDTAAVAEPVLPIVNDSAVTANADEVEQSRDLEAAVEPAVPNLPIAPLASEHEGVVPASRAPTGEEVIVIKANDESWAEVVDANGYQLLYFLLRPGIERRLQGQSPFQVFLGNAPAVELSLNQARFDHTPFHRRNSTARFSVDERL